MAVEIRCKVAPGALIPVSAHDQDQLGLFALGSEVRGMFVRKKSRPMLRLYWATVQEVADGIGEDKVALSLRLLYATGRIDGFHAKDGAVIAVPKSIAAMKALEFKTYVTAALAELFSGDYAAPESKSQIVRLAERKAATTFRSAMAELDREIEEAA